MSVATLTQLPPDATHGEGYENSNNAKNLLIASEPCSILV
jgi:hypothetical protein